MLAALCAPTEPVSIMWMSWAPFFHRTSTFWALPDLVSRYMQVCFCGSGARSRQPSLWATHKKFPRDWAVLHLLTRGHQSGIVHALRIASYLFASLHHLSLVDLPFAGYLSHLACVGFSNSATHGDTAVNAGCGTGRIWDCVFAVPRRPVGERHRASSPTRPVAAPPAVPDESACSGTQPPLHHFNDRYFSASWPARRQAVDAQRKASKGPIKRSDVQNFHIDYLQLTFVPPSKRALSVHVARAAFRARCSSSKILPLSPDKCPGIWF
ncbi:hypothetical protein K458DRAFT_81373 [Lentithecium fluviatile CBS 122367]|uniref:Uncharacterized protein n=1 Tax=Lentithecium fluviatile CBS 122367 TaxID=1168545 RepID=A0A6G1ITR7_9PLEO|nr:hypothetical protein K458DRAFT_81373 [Lentithecium fluviatile CBS 122367]